VRDDERRAHAESPPPPYALRRFTHAR
jgi:hypothetical protein